MKSGFATGGNSGSLGNLDGNGLKVLVDEETPVELDIAISPVTEK